MVSTPDRLGTLVTVYLSLSLDDLNDLAEDGRALLTWESPNRLARHAVGRIAQVVDLTVRAERVVTDAELAADRETATRLELVAHAPRCEHGTPQPAWCEACQRDWEGT